MAGSVQHVPELSHLAASARCAARAHATCFQRRNSRKFAQTALNRIAINPGARRSVTTSKSFQPVPSRIPIPSSFCSTSASGIDQLNLFKHRIASSIIARVTSDNQVVKICWPAAGCVESHGRIASTSTEIQHAAKAFFCPTLAHSDNACVWHHGFLLE